MISWPPSPPVRPLDHRRLAVRGTHGTTELVGRMLRLLQTGNLQTYAFLFALGVAFVLYLALK